jgi:hypothetical protein
LTAGTSKVIPVVSTQTVKFYDLAGAARAAANETGFLRNQINSLKSKSITIEINMTGGVDWSGIFPGQENMNLLRMPYFYGDTSGVPMPVPRTYSGPSTKVPIKYRKFDPKTERPYKPGQKKPKKAASGLDMIVPSGYNADNYPIWTTSGERVTVLTKAQQRSMEFTTPGNYSNQIMVAAKNPQSQLTPNGQTVTIYGGLHLYDLASKDDLLSELSGLMI